MYHRFLLNRNPLALVEIEVMFWNAGCIYDTKVRALNRSLILVVPWCRFTNIVRTCPDKLSSIASVVTVKVHEAVAVFPNPHDHFHNLTVHNYAQVHCYVSIHVQGDSNFLVYGLLMMFLNRKSTILDA